MVENSCMNAPTNVPFEEDDIEYERNRNETRQSETEPGSCEILPWAGAHQRDESIQGTRHGDGTIPDIGTHYYDCTMLGIGTRHGGLSIVNEETRQGDRTKHDAGTRHGSGTLLGEETRHWEGTVGTHYDDGTIQELETRHGDENISCIGTSQCRGTREEHITGVGTHHGYETIPGVGSRHVDESLQGEKASKGNGSHHVNVIKDAAGARHKERTIRGKNKRNRNQTTQRADNINRKSGNSFLVSLPAKPPRDWGIQHLFKELADEVTAECLKKIKCVFKGEDGFGRGVLNKLTAIDMFDLLLKSCFVSDDNVLYLQACLPRGLAIKVYEFAKLRRNVLHFDPPLKDTVHGHRLSTVCVRGKDFRFFSPGQLTELVTRVKDIALAPPSHQSLPEDISMHIRLEMPSRDNVSGFDVSVERGQESYLICVDVGVQKNDLRENEYQLIKMQLASCEEKKKILQKENSDLQKTVEEHKQALHISTIQNVECSKLQNENVLLSEKLSQKNKEISELSSEVQEMDEKIDALTEIRVCKSFTRHSEGRGQVEIQTDNELREMKDQLQRLTTEFDTYKFAKEAEIKELEDRLEMSEASLRNIQNEKGWNEFGEKMQKLSSMSMAVKKVYGNFDPYHDPISWSHDEHFRQTFTAKVGRLFPQVYYNPMEGKF